MSGGLFYLAELAAKLGIRAGITYRHSYDDRGFIPSEPDHKKIALEAVRQWDKERPQGSLDRSARAESIYKVYHYPNASLFPWHLEIVKNRRETAKTLGFPDKASLDEYIQNLSTVPPGTIVMRED